MRLRSAAFGGDRGCSVAGSGGLGEARFGVGCVRRGSVRGRLRSAAVPEERLR